MTTPNPEYLSVTEGQILMLSQGDYSDYFVIGVFRALKAFNFEEAKETFLSSEEWRKTPEGRKGGVYGATDLFVPWLERNGYTEAIEVREVHCGSYGDFEVAAK